MGFLEGVLTQTELYAIAAAAVGVLIAFLVRFALARLSIALDKRSNIFSSNVATTVESSARFAFWMVFFGTLVMVYRILGDETGWDPTVISKFVPKLMLSIVFLGFGHLIGVLLRDITRNSIRDAGLRQLTTRVVYFIPVIVGVFISMETLGIDISFMRTFGLMVLTIVLATLGLAYALGARDHIANLIARRELADYHAGDQVKIGEIEGTVVEMTRTSMVLSTAQGQVTVPASKITSSITVRLLDER